jgi:hypothetical protein
MLCYNDKMSTIKVEMKINPKILEMDYLWRLKGIFKRERIKNNVIRGS